MKKGDEVEVMINNVYVKAIFVQLAIGKGIIVTDCIKHMENSSFHFLSLSYKTIKKTKNNSAREILKPGDSVIIKVEGQYVMAEFNSYKDLSRDRDIVVRYDTCALCITDYYLQNEFEQGDIVQVKTPTGWKPKMFFAEYQDGYLVADLSIPAYSLTTEMLEFAFDIKPYTKPTSQPKKEKTFGELIKEEAERKQILEKATKKEEYVDGFKELWDYCKPTKQYNPQKDLKWGSYGKEGTNPIRWIRLIDMSTDHIIKVLQLVHIGEEYTLAFESILKDRE